MIDTIKFWWNPREFNKSSQGKALHKKWAKMVYIQYNYTCAKCKYKAGGQLSINAHHLNAKDWFPREAYDLHNGVCLCEKCHKDFHNHMGGTRVKCTKNDFNEWLSKPKKII